MPKALAGCTTSRAADGPQVSDTVRDTLVTMMQQDPQQSGYVATLWTVAMLALALFQKLDLRLRPTTVRSALQALDLRWAVQAGDAGKDGS